MCETNKTLNPGSMKRNENCYGCNQGKPPHDLGERNLQGKLSSYIGKIQKKDWVHKCCAGKLICGRGSLEAEAMEENAENSQNDEKGKMQNDEKEKIQNDEKEKTKKKDSKSKEKNKTEQQQNSEGSSGNNNPLELKMRKKKALLEFRCMMEDAILGNYLLEKPPTNSFDKNLRKSREQLREISLWGVPLLPSKGHEATDTILLKFLKVKDFKVHDAFEMLRKTLKWRKDNIGNDAFDDDLRVDLEKIVYVSSVGKEGHPLYYNVYGAFNDEDLYKKLLGTEENQEKFLRWQVHSLENGIKQVSFKNGEIDSVLQITDLKNLPGTEMKELQTVIKRGFVLFQANYPEIVYKNILINVPLWNYTNNVFRSKVLDQRTKKSFIWARPSKVTQTLLKYISSENLPVQYGGLKRDNDADFSTADKASELIVKANTSGHITIPITEAGVTIVWDLMVVGWDVTYKEEFIPDDEGSYRITLKSGKKSKTETSLRNSFYIGEPGKIVVSLENTTLKKKRIYYRSKVKPTLPSYMSFKKF